VKMNCHPDLILGVKMNCHPDRSVAKWRDLLFVRSR
jgi:hypothetical protein